MCRNTLHRGSSFGYHGWKTLRSEDRPSAFRVTLSGALETWYSFTWEPREGTYQVSGPGGRVRANAEARSSNRSVFEVKLKPLRVLPPVDRTPGRQQVR